MIIISNKYMATKVTTNLTKKRANLCAVLLLLYGALIFLYFQQTHKNNKIRYIT